MTTSRHWLKSTFAKKVSREKRIPFELAVDPFYSDGNMVHLRRGIAALNMGKGVAHEPIEEDSAISIHLPSEVSIL